MQRIVLIASALACLAAAGPAGAAITQFTERSTFLTAAGAVTVDDFDALAEGSIAGSTDFGPYTVFSYTGAIVPGDNLNGTTALAFNLFMVSPLGPGLLTFTFDAPIYAFGADFVSLNNDYARTTATLNGTTFDPLPLGSPFLGYVSTTAFTTLTFTNPLGGFDNDAFRLDNLTYGGSAALALVPEPATWALMIIGFGLIGAALRRHQADEPSSGHFETAAAVYTLRSPMQLRLAAAPSTRSIR